MYNNSIDREFMNLRPHQQRAFDNMQSQDCSQIIIPTGGGKTYIMIADCDREVSSTDRNYKTFVVVAPRILLANQLSEEFESVIKSAKIMHVHSGAYHLGCDTIVRDRVRWDSRHGGGDRF